MRWRNKSIATKTLTMILATFGSSSLFRSSHHRCAAFFVHRVPRQRSRRTFAATASSSDNDNDDGGFFADESVTFRSLGVGNDALLSGLSARGLVRPTAVQAAAFGPILSGNNVVVGAETGSGKTLAYLLPLVDDVLKQKSSEEKNYDYCRAVILVPNKELAGQVSRMAKELDAVEVVRPAQRPSSSDPASNNGDDKVRLAVMPGGLDAPQDFRPFRETESAVDLVVCTPAALGPFGTDPRNVGMFADIPTLVVDEADMLLDGGYLRPLENVLMGFRRADKLLGRRNDDDDDDAEDDGFSMSKKTQHVFLGATLPDYGLKSVDAYIRKKFPDIERVNMPGLHAARHFGLRKDAGTLWLPQRSADNNRDRIETLVELLGGAKGSEDEFKEHELLTDDKVMVFLNTVEDVDGASNALRRAGFDAVPYHAKIPLAERADNLARFRDYSDESSSNPPPILVCTDLASRGLDVPGVTAVVQLQFAGNVVAHLHRMGRCGRAGRRDGRGVVFYGPNERELVEVVRQAETNQGRMTVEGDVLDLEEEKDGTVRRAFSRKRGFTKKRKKNEREARRS